MAKRGWCSMTEIYLRPRNPNCKCKWCAFLRITIVPPSNEQYCSNLGKYVKLESLCPDFKCKKGGNHG